MPVLTGMVAVMVVSAGVTVIELAAKSRRAARLNVVHGAQRRGEHPVAQWSSVGRAMDAEDGRSLAHHRSLMRRLLACDPRAAALTGRGVERLVVGGEECPRYACMSRRLPPASSRWVAQRWRSVGTDACVWRERCWRASRSAP